MIRNILFIICLVLLFGFKGSILTPYSFPELKYFPIMPVSELNPVTNEGAELGRFLFYDPLLSLDSTISCSSCHRQEVAFSDSPNKVSFGVNNVKGIRNTPPLYNLSWYPSLFWDGRARDIENQIFHPVRNKDEMNLNWVVAAKRIKESPFYSEKFREVFGSQKIDSNLIVKAIGQFERTLLSYNSKYDKVLKGEAYLSKEEYEGFVLMNDQTKGDCLHCHTTDGDALGTTLKFSNNGLDFNTEDSNFMDNGKGAISHNTFENGMFKIPSLRNIAITSPYMHDGRFESLEEVLNFYSEGVIVNANIDSKMVSAHKGGVHLNPEEKKNIISFLNTLTDSVLITNPKWGNPFK